MKEELLAILRKLFPATGGEVVTLQRMAEHLIANGVTVHRWRSVTERLPDHPYRLEVDEADDDELAEVFYSKPVFVYDGEVHLAQHYTTGEWLSVDSDAWYKDVTHWMPLPELP